MNERAEIVKVAVSQIGYKEGQNNYTKYGVWYGLPHDPWCAMFVSWCAYQAKIPESVILKFAYVPYGVQFFKKQNRWKNRGYVPQPGDIIFYGSNGSTGAHVGIVEKAVNGSVVAIEGNTSAAGNSSNGDGVYRRTRSLGNSWIMGYGVPAYKEDEEVDVKDISVKNEDTTKFITVQSVNIDGTNYIKLRDMEKLFPCSVGWDGKNPTIRLNYNK